MKYGSNIHKHLKLATYMLQLLNKIQTVEMKFNTQGILKDIFFNSNVTLMLPIKNENTKRLSYSKWFSDKKKKILYANFITVLLPDC